MTEQSLIYRCGGHLHALALGHVVEIMRPLPIDAPLEDAPLFKGMCTIRGESVPVFDFAPLIGSRETAPTRLINIRAGDRRFAILADEVLGVQAAPRNAPSFLDDAGEDLKAAVAELDSDLRSVLEAMRALPEQAIA